MSMIDKMRAKAGKPIPKPAPLPPAKKPKKRRDTAARDAKWITKGRLPDGAVIQAHYNGATTSWSVLLTVPGMSFSATGPGHFGACEDCWKQYLEWQNKAAKLTAEAAG